MRFMIMNRRWKKCKLVAAVKFCFDYYQNLKERMRCTQVKLPATFADYHLLKCFAVYIPLTDVREKLNTSPFFPQE